MDGKWPLGALIPQPQFLDPQRQHPTSPCHSLLPNPPLPTPPCQPCQPRRKGEKQETQKCLNRNKEKRAENKNKKTQKQLTKKKKKALTFCIRTHMRNCNNNGASQNGEINHPKGLLKKDKRETERKNRQKTRNNKKHRSGPPFGQCTFEGPCGFACLGSTFSVAHRQVSTLPTNRQPPTANHQPPTTNRSLCQSSLGLPNRHRTTTARMRVMVETCDLMLFKRILWISEFCFAILQCILITRHSDATFLQTQ